MKPFHGIGLCALLFFPLYAMSRPEHYPIYLSDRKVASRFDGNTNDGKYMLSDDRITFDSMLSPRKACFGDSLVMVCLGDLQRVVAFFVENVRLYLKLPSGDETVVMMLLTKNPHGRKIKKIG